ncbi:MAG: chorismate synthase [Leptospiraceae bacterium]|nr:chorismate synthase [Leptospiraceae bacterium]
MSSSTGTLYKISTFGESHGAGVGVIVDGCPAGIRFDAERIQRQLSRRRPGQGKLSTPRKEADEFEVLSGVYEGYTLGTTIAMMVRNTNAKGNDYLRWADIYRPSHADYTYHIKYGYRTPLGGGRASVRETIGRVAAGELAAQILEEDLGIRTVAWVDSIGTVDSPVRENPPNTSDEVDAFEVRCPHKESAERMTAEIEAAKLDGNSVGGTIGVIVYNVPPGLGDPVFDKLEADLARACLSIPACKGFESGSGFEGTRLRGSEHNDIYEPESLPPEPDKRPGIEGVPVLRTLTNRSGGIQGGISNGMPILLRLAFKPTATIKKRQDSVNEHGEATTLRAGGRHDPCVLPRAVPIVESVVNLTLMDAYLRQRAARPEWWLRFVKNRG